MNKPLILVVEDDAPVRNLITTTLKLHDYRFLTAANGETALIEASSHNPDIILLDEPINAIDGEGVEEIRSLILSLKNEKRIIIVACHDKEEMNLLADEIVHLRDGRIEGQENGGAA